MGSKKAHSSFYSTSFFLPKTLSQICILFIFDRDLTKPLQLCNMNISEQGDAIKNDPYIVALNSLLALEGKLDKFTRFGINSQLPVGFPLDKIIDTALTHARIVRAKEADPTAIANPSNNERSAV